MTNSSSSPTTSSSSCEPCIKLLQEILSHSDSRPLRLLESLSGGTSQLHWQSTAQGVQVALPPPNVDPPRRWTRLAVNQYATNNDNDGTPNQQPNQPTNNVPPVADSTFALASSPTTKSTTAPTWLQIRCKHCSQKGPEGGARAFVMGPTPLSVVICQNRLYANTPQGLVDEMQEILTHELMHVYDVQQLRLDLRDCESLAYSEIRAARHAECYKSNNHSVCTQQKALTATLNLFPKQARDCVKKVFEQAFADTRPFVKTTTTTASSSASKPDTTTDQNVSRR